MIKFIKAHGLVSVLVALVLIFGASAGVYAYTTLATAHSTVSGTITVNPYIAPSPTPTPTPTPTQSVIYIGMANPIAFQVIGTADSSGYATISQSVTTTVTDNSSNGKLNGVSDINLSGSLPQGLTLTCTDAFPVSFSNGTLTLHFNLSGNLQAGNYNLATGSPVINIDCY